MFKRTVKGIIRTAKDGATKAAFMPPSTHLQPLRALGIRGSHARIRALPITTLGKANRRELDAMMLRQKGLVIKDIIRASTEQINVRCTKLKMAAATKWINITAQIKHPPQQTGTNQDTIATTDTRREVKRKMTECKQPKMLGG